MPSAQHGHASPSCWLGQGGATAHPHADMQPEPLVSVSAPELCGRLLSDLACADIQPAGPFYAQPVTQAVWGSSFSCLCEQCQALVLPCCSTS